MRAEARPPSPLHIWGLCLSAQASRRPRQDKMLPERVGVASG